LHQLPVVAGLEAHESIAASDSGSPAIGAI
jgi:hypothetical protein